jgi:hypothetical protein
MVDVRFPTPAPPRMEERAIAPTPSTALVEHALLVQSDSIEVPHATAFTMLRPTIPSMIAWLRDSTPTVVKVDFVQQAALDLRAAGNPDQQPEQAPTGVAQSVPFDTALGQPYAVVRHRTIYLATMNYEREPLCPR